MSRHVDSTEDLNLIHPSRCVCVCVCVCVSEREMEFALMSRGM